MHDNLGISDEVTFAMDRPRGFSDRLAVTGEVLLELRGTSW